jgi:hypothetical protein
MAVLEFWMTLQKIAAATTLIKPHFDWNLLRIQVIWALHGYFVNAANPICAT